MLPSVKWRYKPCTQMLHSFILRWHVTVEVLETFGEVALRRETDTVSNLRDSQLALSKQALRMTQTDKADEL